MRRRFGGIALLAGVLLLAAACGSSDDSGGALESEAPVASAAATAAAAKATGTVTVEDQHSDGSSLTVKAVTITGGSGFIAVHIDANGAPGPVVGHGPVKEGSNSDVVVKFDSVQKTGKFWPMLHVDAGTIGTYEFPGPDVPVPDADGKTPVMKQITLTVM